MPPMQTLDVAILGGGIGGLSTAIALHQAGFAPVVYERRKSPSHLGAGLMCWPNATFVLSKLGVWDALRSHAGSPMKMERRTSDDVLLGSIDIASIDAAMGSTSHSVLRKDLHACLLDRLRKLGGDVRFDREVATLEPGPTGARVVFSDGVEIAPDLVLGAEGRMASAARAFVLGDNTPTYQGFVNWIGTIETSTELFGDMCIKDIWGVGKRFGIVPITSRRAYWAAGEAQERPKPLAPEHRQAHLQKQFAGWPQAAQAIVESEAAYRCYEVHVYDHAPTNRWHRDNVLLLGDAAHAALPTSGQGACQALEDAWHLSEALARWTETTPLAEILAKFTEMRRGKTAQITSAGRGLATSLFHTDPAYCEERNRQAQSADYDALAKGMAALWGQGFPALCRRTSQ